VSAEQRRRWNWLTGYGTGEGVQEREQQAARGLLGTSATPLGLGLAGTAWTLGQVLKYSLLGWTIDASGVPRVDKESLATFDKWYKRAAGIAA